MTTKQPWRIEAIDADPETGGADYAILEGDTVIAEFNLDHETPQRIVTCVNTYDDLLAALQLLSQWREVIAKSDVPAKSAILEDFDDARAAIAKATGGSNASQT